jgi:hypothetical protein
MKLFFIMFLMILSGCKVSYHEKPFFLTPEEKQRVLPIKIPVPRNHVLATGVREFHRLYLKGLDLNFEEKKGGLECFFIRQESVLQLTLIHEKDTVFIYKNSKLWNHKEELNQKNKNLAHMALSLNHWLKEGIHDPLVPMIQDKQEEEDL